MKNLYSRTWFDKFLTPYSVERTAIEVDFLNQLMNFKSGDSLLDVCCGTGRHLKILDEMGVNVTGVEISDKAFETLKELSLKNSALIQADAFEYQPENDNFDFAICMWQSFGYGTSQQNVGLIQSINASLKGNGLFFLDIYNREFFERFLGKKEFEVDGKKVTETKRIENNRLINELDYEDSSETDEFDWEVYSQKEIKSLMFDNGFKLVSSHSNFSKDDIPNKDNPRAQYLFRKL